MFAVLEIWSASLVAEAASIQFYRFLEMLRAFLHPPRRLLVWLRLEGLGMVHGRSHAFWENATDLGVRHRPHSFEDLIPSSQIFKCTFQYGRPKYA